MTDGNTDGIVESASEKTLPIVLAGPLLRHLTADRLVLWLVTSTPVTIRLRLDAEGPRSLSFDRILSDREVTSLRFGEHAYLQLLDVAPDDPLPENVPIRYDFGLAGDCAGPWRWIADWAPHLCHPGNPSPDFVLKHRLDRILHGSCRRPHHPAEDGLVRVDEELLACRDRPAERPALLLMTGDQIYADDVAGPLLRAIHGLIERLGLYHENLEGAVVDDSRALLDHPDTYYRRHHLLPATQPNAALLQRFFGGARKPVFTTASAHNHLISLAEVMAMYLLVWSPMPWQLVAVSEPDLNEEDLYYYRRDLGSIERFSATLPRAARTLAHLPTYMIFDDHDVTDDWNLSALWESTAYGHPFSRRIIGNALIGYLLCQGWGNKPDAFKELMPALEKLLNGTEPGGLLAKADQDLMVERLLAFQHWHYRLATQPPMIVLNTRTRRWRSDIVPGHPSGLMDWEALTEFQQAVMNERSVVVVSPAPMFGVKLIEAVQRIYTLFGKPLLVDAENWMAHRGAANVLMNIFGHSRTPQNFVILSGDVHYSFAYDVRLRHKKQGPRIWQITSSGIKNEFPNTLLEWLDRSNRWLYAPWSPLNWFTKRRRMRVTPRLPDAREAGERLWNQAGVGLVELDKQGVPTRIAQLGSDGSLCCFHIHPEQIRSDEAKADQAKTGQDRPGQDRPSRDRPSRDRPGQTRRGEISSRPDESR